MLTCMNGFKVDLSLSLSLHDFSVCLLYFLSTQKLVPLKLGHGAAMQEAESEEPGLLSQDGNCCCRKEVP